MNTNRFIKDHCVVHLSTCGYFSQGWVDWYSKMFPRNLLHPDFIFILRTRWTVHLMFPIVRWPSPIIIDRTHRCLHLPTKFGCRKEQQYLIGKNTYLTFWGQKHAFLTIGFLCVLGQPDWIKVALRIYVIILTLSKLKPMLRIPE